MNKLEFLNVLESHGKGKFQVLAHNGYLRATIDTKTYCPITFVCMVTTGQYFPSREFPDAADAIGITHEFASGIVDAADHQIQSMSRVFRHDMLTVLGLD